MTLQMFRDVRVSALVGFLIVFSFPACYGVPEDDPAADDSEADGSGEAPGDGKRARDGGGPSDGGKKPDGGSGAKCVSDFNCPTSDLPWCDTESGRCVECLLDGQCFSGVCDNGTRTCVEADDDAGAGKDSGGSKDAGYPSDAGPKDTGPVDPCTGVTCSGHGSCVNQGGTASCSCESGYVPSGLDCVKNDACGGCSGHGTCMTHGAVNVCACDPGYTAGDAAGRTCVPTSQVCAGGPIDYDVDGDGTNESTFEPSAIECEMYELINYTRATHNDEGSPECHTPLGFSVEWSAHGRNHSKKQYERGGLFHEDYPFGQNCAYGCDPACEMNMYMTGPSEPHCPPLSHHCNIMRCEFGHVGVGYWPPDTGTWNTQNFY